ncbi:membrane protein [Devosia crocina]|uniref:Membrane protein n=1 Tax=Devosia crocina TaxID=429728 RepID=A0A1I7NUU5_9HYPH|nr:YihY/virulence factor BrkB family protein [Devosia crocina]SFV38410.1 membrane protein [Devosia crocina]
MDDTGKQYATQAGRGRDADSPTEIPFPGWKDIIYRLYRAITEDRILLTAAGTTFYMLLALVPTLSAFVSVYGLFNDPSTVLGHVELLAGLVPPGVLEVLREQLTRLTSESDSTLGLTLLISLAVAMWSASNGVKAMFEAMNIAYHEQERRSFIKLNAVALLFTLGGSIAALLVSAVVLILPALLAYFSAGEGMQWVIRVAAYAVMLIMLSLGVAALYRWGPSREQARWRWITPGAVLAVLALGVTSVLYSWYVANFSDDNAAYGSLGAVIGLMIWLWISVTIITVGAELNSEIEHQTAVDSTTGEEKPIGERGANMADTVGRAWPPDREKVERKTRDRSPAGKFSLGSLLFALPAAVALHAANSRRRKGK